MRDFNAEVGKGDTNTVNDFDLGKRNENKNG